MFARCDTPSIVAVDADGHDVLVFQGCGDVSSGLACALEHAESITLSKANSFKSALPQMILRGWLHEPLNLVVTNHETNVIATALLADTLRGSPHRRISHGFGNCDNYRH